MIYNQNRLVSFVEVSASQGQIQDFREEDSFSRLSASVRKHALLGGSGGLRDWVINAT